MIRCKANKPFDDDTLKNMDIIHDPNTKFFKDQYDPSYIIPFITEQEREQLLKFWYDEYENVGWNINGHIVNIPHPIRYDIVADIIKPKIYKHFGDDIVFYSDISNDPVSVGDQMFKSIRPYGLHTDSVTHIKGYRPYKDIIIPCLEECLQKSMKCFPSLTGDCVLSAGFASAHCPVLSHQP